MISPILNMYLYLYTKPYTTHLARSVDISKRILCIDIHHNKL